MRPIEVLQAIKQDHEEIRDLSKRVREQLRRGGTRGPLEALAVSVLDFNVDVLIPHTEAEDLALMHVAREHMADIHQARLEEADLRREELLQAFKDLKSRVQGGEDLRIALWDVAAAMHDYVEFEDNVLVPWLEQELGTILLREVAQRFEAIRAAERGEIEAPVTVDLEALARVRVPP